MSADFSLFSIFTFLIFKLGACYVLKLSDGVWRSFSLKTDFPGSSDSRRIWLCKFPLNQFKESHFIFTALLLWKNLLQDLSINRKYFTIQMNNIVNAQSHRGNLFNTKRDKLDPLCLDLSALISISSIWIIKR